MTATAIRRTGLLLALTATLLVAALVLIGRAGADDGDTLPAPTGLRVTAERGSLDVSLDWDDVSGAAHYRVRWRPAGPDNNLNDGVQVRSSSAVITVARYGEWVARVQACDDAGCGAPLAKKFRVRRPRAVPDITPLPTSTPTPLPTATPTPEPTATPTPLPTATLTPEPTATSTPLPTSTHVPGALLVSVSASSSTLPVNQSVSLTAAVSNAPAGSDPSYAWELSSGGDWSSHGTGPTLSYLSNRAESWSFRVTVTYGSGLSATSGALTVTWVEVPPTPTATPVPLPTSTPTPLPTATPIPEPSVPIPDEPTGLSVSATPGSLEVSVDWDDVSGASYYWVRWRVSGSGSELSEGVVVLPSEAVIAVSGYGEWVVRAQACNDAGCGAPTVSKFAIELEPTATPTPEPLGKPQNLEVIAEPGSKALLATWDEVEGATSYKLRWREDGEEFETADAATVSDAIWGVTVPGYGRWELRVQACNDDGCGPETAATVEVVRAASLSLERAVDSQGNVRSRTLSVSWDPVEGASSYTLSWQRLGANARTQTQAQPADARQARSASVVSGKSANARTTDQLTFGADETGTDFSVPDDGAYRAEFRALNVDGELIALASSHVDQAPGQPDTTPPRLVRGEIDGDTMTFYFSEPMDESATGSQFRVFFGWVSPWAHFTAHPSRVEVSGSQVTVHGLSRNGWPRYERAGTGYHVRVYYYKDDRVFPAGQRLRDLAGNEVWTPHRSLGGHLPATRTIWLQNLTAPPALRSAEAHPRWLTLTFDERLDENSVPSASAFTVTVNGSVVSLAGDNPVAVSGDTVTLVLASPLASADVVTVSYARPSANPLRGPDGEAPSFSGRSVTNQVGAVPSVSQVAITSTPADGEAYASDETVQVSLTFTEAVNVTGTPRLRIKLVPAYGERWADYSGGSGTATLTFGYTVAEPDRSTRGIAVLRDRLELNGGTIRSTATQKDAHRWHPGLDHDPSPHGGLAPLGFGDAVGDGRGYHVGPGG